ncbi:MAG: hypothetical protein MJ189_05220, partial [Coriobacteriales bacterium]|nr:hypothetical protein [Coriobacteriales bacterium]
ETCEDLFLDKTKRIIKNRTADPENVDNLDFFELFDDIYPENLIEDLSCEYYEVLKPKYTIAIKEVLNELKKDDYKVDPEKYGENFLQQIEDCLFDNISKPNIKQCFEEVYTEEQIQKLESIYNASIQQTNKAAVRKVFALLGIQDNDADEIERSTDEHKGPYSLTNFVAELTSMSIKTLEDSVAKMIVERYKESSRYGYNIEELTLDRRRPTDVLVVSPRVIPQNVSLDVLEDFGSVPNAIDSEFCLRNHYPDNARFILYDCEQNTYKHFTNIYDFTRDEFKFWNSIVMLIVNPEFVHTLKAYSLYVVDLELDFSKYSQLAFEKLQLAKNGLKIIKAEIDNMQVSLSPDVHERKTIPNYDIVIQPDLLHMENIDASLDPKRYGWLKDSIKPYPVDYRREGDASEFSLPKKMTLGHQIKNFFYGIGSIGKRMNEMPPVDEERFEQDERHIKRGLDRALREPRRAIAIATADFRHARPFSEDELTGTKLNEFDKKDLEEDLENIETELASDYSFSMVTTNDFRLQREKMGEGIKKRMYPRTYLKEVILFVLFILLGTAISCVPYIFGLLGGHGKDLTALFVTIALFVLLILIGFIPLKISHIEVKQKLKVLLSYIESVLESIKYNVEHLGDRLSQYATYKKGYTLLDAQRSNSKPYTKRLITMYQVEEELEKFIYDFEKIYNPKEYIIDSDFDDSFANCDQVIKAVESKEDFVFQPLYKYKTCPIRTRTGDASVVYTPYDFNLALSFDKLNVIDRLTEKGVVK